jgi:flagellar biosynthesis GTPase FlhF
MSGNSTSNNKKRGARRRHFATSIDLHGYFKDRAVSELTSFLEEHRVAGTTAVQIITGTGSHSSGTGGPVLRCAVESLLERRKMEYSRNTPGSFLANPQSGQVWYSQQAASEDTKVILRDANNDDIRIQQAAAKAARNRQYSSKTTTSFDTTSSRSSTPLLDLVGPSLKEVVRCEDELNRAREESLEVAKQVTKEDRELRKVLSVSQSHLELEEQEERDLLDKAVALSKEGEELERQTEERLLQQALAESQREQSLFRESHEQKLQEALSRSLMDVHVASSTDHRQQDEEERMIQQALALSLQ